MALRSTLDFFLEEVFRLPIQKVLDPNDPHDFATIANALAKATAGLAQADEAKALKAALAALDVDWKSMKADAKLKVVNAAKAAVNPVKTVLPKIEQHFEANAIKLGMQVKGATKKTFGFAISPDLTAVQLATLNHVAFSQGNYVRDEYGKRSTVFATKAKEIVAQELAKGAAQKDIVDRLHSELTAQQFNRSKAYWNVVSNAFANRARTYTNLSSYQEAGITHFEFESVLDQRTSHICRLMHGRKFPVAQALSAHAASEKSGGDVKTSMPWVSDGAKDADGNPTLRTSGGVLVATVTSSAMGKVDEKGSFEGATSVSLANLGIMVPPLHGNCRSSILPIMGSHTVLAPSGPMPADLALPPEPPPFALTPSEPTAEAPAKPAPLAPDHTDQEALFFEGGGHGNKPLEIHPEQQGFMFGPGGIIGKPIEVPALDPTKPPVVAVIPFKDKAIIAQSKLDAMKLLPDATAYSVPNPITVKKSPLLGINPNTLEPNDKPTQDIVDAAIKHWKDGFPGYDYGMKHMPKKLESLKSSRDLVDIAKVEMYLKNPKLINEAMNNGEIVAVKIGKDVFIVKGHEAVAAAHLMDRAELKIVEINLKSAMAKVKDKAEDAAEALAKLPPLKAVSIPPAPLPPPVPPPPPPPAKLGAPIDPADIMHEKTNRPGGGSNAGAFYKDKNGVERFVKVYDQASQAHGEVLANSLYRALGQGGPEAVTWQTDELNAKGEKKQAYAAKLVDGKQLGLSPGREKARKFFDGFAADVLTANWDAAGMSGDNAFVTKDGQIIRLDNGGAFLMRAQKGRRKDTPLLNKIGEIDTYFPNNKQNIANDGYHALAKEAGYKSVEDFKDSFKKQVAEISALKARHGGWDSFVSQYAPGMPAGADRDAIVGMLEARHKLLEEKVIELDKPKPEKPKGGSGALNVKPGDALNTGYRAPPIDGVPPSKTLTPALLPETEPPGKLGRQRNSMPDVMPSGEKTYDYQGSSSSRAAKAVANLKPDEKHAIELFTGSGYTSIRDDEERGTPNRSSAAIQRAFDNAIAEPGTVYRGIKNMPPSVIESWLKHTDEDGPFRLGRGNVGASSSTAWHPDVSVHNSLFMDGPTDHSSGDYKILFKIQHRSGIPVSTISASGKGECEVMLPKSAEFRIKQIAKWEGTERVLIIELEEIGDGVGPVKKPRRPRKPKAID